MPRLLCFGDSNTHGTPPVLDRSAMGRYGPEVRWTRRLATALGPEWEVVEDGLPGRTAMLDDPIRGAHMNGLPGLRMALMSHWPLDAITIMLGTNDTKARFAQSAEAIATGIVALLDLLQGAEFGPRYPGLKILLIAPTPCIEAGLLAWEFHGTAEKGRALAPLLQEVAERRGCGFLDAGAHIAVSAEDGVHLSPESHATLAVAVERALGAMG